MALRSDQYTYIGVIDIYLIASEAKRACKRALSHVVVDEFHLQNPKIALTQKINILEACCMAQKVFGCTCFTHL